MCCFTDVVEKVSDTNIFARGIGKEQLLVYSMRYGARNELAMVLPIPVVPGCAESAVRFISLEDCPGFFGQLADGFPTRYEEELGATLGGDETLEAERTLVVHDVGAFEASFVPGPADFARLDERFRLPVPIWTHLGHYRDWGFAVFKLKPASLADVHPMAFTFPRKDPSRLFFPTLHIHDRRLDTHAVFDHMLYCQVEPALNWHLAGWEDSLQRASEFMRCEPGRRLVELDACCWRRALEGRLENRDTWVGRAAN